MSAAPLLIAALALALAAVVCALRALTARSMFTVSMSVAACGAACAGALLALGAENAAIGAALLGAGFAPLLLLAGTLLSAPTVRATRKGPPWLALCAAIAPVGVLVWSSFSLASRPSVLGVSADLAPWLMLLAFAGVLCPIGLLGFGERGVLGRGSRGAP